MNWDPFQRDALEAMGLRLYEVRDAGAAVARLEEPPQAAHPVEAPARTPDAPVSERLLAALARAAGRPADDPAALALCRSLLPAGGLHDAATRRALWRRLRALRSGARP